jgi:hypothetical protein
MMQIYYSMKKNIILLLLMSVGMAVQAQTNLAGREYYNANILEDQMRKISQTADDKLDEVKAKALKEAQEKKKRDLTAAEKAEVEKKVEDGRKMLQAMEKGMKTAVTVTFKDDKNVVVKIDMKIDDAVMKAAGIGWAKRKMMQAAISLMPSQKAKYRLSGNMIVLEDDEEPDTMFLSDDGKYLTGKLDEKKPFKLTRTK